MDFKELLLRQAKNFPNKPAIIFRERKISFSSLKNSSFKIANYLKKKGIKKEKKVAVFLPNTSETVCVYLSILSLGAVLVPFDFMLTEEEIINLVNHSEAEILIIQPKKGLNLENIRKACFNLREIIVYGEKIPPFLSLEDIFRK